MALNPFTNAEQSVRRSEERVGLGKATVVAVDDETHMVAIKPATASGSGSDTDTQRTPAAVLVDTNGDAHLPSVGDHVIYANMKNSYPVVIGTNYSRRKNVPSFDGAERVVSGSDGVFLRGPFATAPKRSDDPSDAPNGSLWYREDLDEYRGVEGGTVVTFDTTTV